MVYIFYMFIEVRKIKLENMIEIQATLDSKNSIIPPSKWYFIKSKEIWIETHEI